MRSTMERDQQEAMQPVDEVQDSELETLRESEIKLQAHNMMLHADLKNELTVDSNGYITGGALWINGPFVGHSLYTKAKPKPTKCTCQCCGNKHNLKQ